VIRRIARPGPIVFFLVLVAITIAAIGYFRYSRDEQALLRQELANAARLGMPLEPAQLVRHVSPEKNAASDYAEAIKCYAAWKPKAANMKKGAGVNDFKPNLTFSPEELRHYAAAFSTLQPVFDALDKAAAKPDCEFPRKWDEGPKLAFPEGPDLKDFVRLESYYACIQGQLGNMEEAFKHLRVAQKIADDLARDPVVISWYEHVAAEAMITRNLEALISYSKLSTDLLDRSEKFLNSFAVARPLDYYIGGEVVCQRINIHSLPTMSDQDMQQFSPTNDAAFFLLRNRSLQPGLERYAMHMFAEYWKVMPTSMQDFSASKRKAEAIDVKVQADKSIYTLIPGLTSMLYSHLVSSYAQTEAERRAALVGIRIVRSHLAGQPFPASLPNYGVVSTDPMYDEPFHYLKLVNGFIVYNRWPDGLDHASDPGHIRLRFKYEP